MHQADQEQPHGCGGSPLSFVMLHYRGTIIWFSDDRKLKIDVFPLVNPSITASKNLRDGKTKTRQPFTVTRHSGTSYMTPHHSATDSHIQGVLYVARVHNTTAIFK